LPDAKYPNEAACKALFDAVVEKVRQLPGVSAVGTTDTLPFVSANDDHFNTGPFGIVGQPDPDQGHRPRAKLQVISPDYFRTREIPLLKGRGFNLEDEQGKDRVVIVNQELADAYFPGQDPVGKQIHDFAEIQGFARTNYTIVGVVPTIRHASPAVQRTPFQTYFPYGQPHPYIQHEDDFATLVLRTERDPSLLLPAVHRAIASIDPDLPVSDSDSLENVIAKTLQARRAALLLVMLFSSFALALSAVGLYGTLARLVSLRMRDIVALVLSLAALLSCLLPTLRATQIDPMTALRE